MKDEISPFEWVVAALGLVLVLTSIGFVLYQGVAESHGPPEVHVTTDRIQRAGDGWLVTFTAENRGGTTAESLAIEGRLVAAGVELETSAATIDYLPPQSSRRGGLFFTRDPERSKLELRPTGFTDP